MSLLISKDYQERTLVPIWQQYLERVVPSTDPSYAAIDKPAFRILLAGQGYNPDGVNILRPGSSKTVNAGSNAFTGTVEVRLTTAIELARLLGWPYVYVPIRAWDGVVMLPYNASLITFNTAVRMTREGANPNVVDVKAYGAAGDNVANDTVALQAALTSATVGQTVYAPEGTYRFTGVTFPAVKGVVLLGAGREATTLVYTQTTGDGIVFNSTYQRIENLRIEGVGSATAGSLIHGAGAADQCQVVNVHTFQGFHGITFDSGFYRTIDRCTIENFNGNGIYMDGSVQRSIAIACIVLNTGTTGQNGIELGPTSLECLITSCYVRGCGGTQGSGNAGIHVQDHKYGTVVGCMVVACNNQGILLDGATACQYNVIANNVVVGSLGVSGEGITLFGAAIANNTVCDNIVQSCATNGIEVFDAGKYNNVNGNYVEGSVSGTGIFLGNNTGSPFTTVVGNICRLNNFSGIQVHNSANCVVNDNTCTDNDQLASGTVTQQNGITFSESSTRCVCLGNKCRNDAGVTQQAGIRLENTAEADLAFNDVMGNAIAGITDSVALSQRRGNRLSTGVTQGRAVLVGGTVTVSTAEVLAADNIHLTRVVTGGTVGHLSIGTIVAGTSFVISSSSGTDTSTVFWEIVH
ncbi:MAG TPA: right-handed parallel beta-helix repeat-containing protein [Candidatus Bathyarchaeia archaeon]